MFVVLLGGDGVGKTTVLTYLRRWNAAWHFTSASPGDLYPISDLPHMNATLENHPKTFAWKLEPFTRTSFFVHTLFIMFEYHIGPAMREGKIVLCDSYIYRLFAKERLLNPAGDFLLKAAFSAFPSPDLCVTIRLPACDAWLRKGCASPFERYELDGYESFARLQLDVDNEVSAMTSNIRHKYVDGHGSPADVAKAVQSAIEDV
jgi:thymidylate kinase